MTDMYLRFRIRHSKVVVLELQQFECRGDNALILLRSLIKRMPRQLEGKSGLMYFGDNTPHPSWALGVDLPFCSTKRLGEAAVFLEMPCPYTLRWPSVGIDDGARLFEECLNCFGPPEVPKLFWIGAETHPIRRALSELSRQRPDMLDAELMSWMLDGSRVVSRSRYVSLLDHTKYKYLIDCPGFGYSGRLRWLLATGRPVFIIERESVEHWHEEMAPWVHFVPVKKDLSDLMHGFEVLEGNPALAEQIGRRAREFVTEHLLLERQLDRMVASVERHVRFQTCQRTRVRAVRHPKPTR